jgi:ribonuclease VapC
VIVVDTSALMAIVLSEPDEMVYLEQLRRWPRVLISSVSVVEARMVAYGRKGPRALVLLEDLLRRRAVACVPPGLEEAETAFNAFVAYGKGSGHPAGLNFGDVFAYALAKVRGMPLLFKGDDFAKTDIPSALAVFH